MDEIATFIVFLRVAPTVVFKLQSYLESTYTFYLLTSTNQQSEEEWTRMGRRTGGQRRKAPNELRIYIIGIVYFTKKDSGRALFDKKAYIIV